MPKRTNDFQSLIFDIQRQLSGGAVVTESKLFQDRQTGKPVEVDVVIESKSGDFDVVIGLEVRARGRPATVEWVREMLGKHSSLPTNKLVLVSKSGFTPEALRKASENNIETIIYEAAKTFDWSEIVKRVGQGKELTIVSFDMYWDNFTLRLGEVELNEPSDIDAIQTARSQISLDAYYHNPSKGERTQLKQIPSVLLHNHEIAEKIMDSWIRTGKEKFILDANVPLGGYVEATSYQKLPVTGFRLEGHCKVNKAPITFRHGTLHNIQVTHGVTENVFKHILASPNTVQVTILEKEGQKPVGALTFSSNDQEERKSFPLRLPGISND